MRFPLRSDHELFPSPNHCRSPAATRVQQSTALGLQRQPTNTRATKNWTGFSSWPPGTTVNPDRTQAHHLQGKKLHILLLAQQTADALPSNSLSASYGVIWELCKQTSAVYLLCVIKKKKQTGISPLVFTRCTNGCRAKPKQTAQKYRPGRRPHTSGSYAKFSAVW